MAPSLIGPRHITGLSGSSRRKAIEMTFSPWGPTAGCICPSSTFRSALSRPSILGTLGPVMSMSIRPTFWPCLARDRASPVATVDLPTPPLPESTITLCLICSSIWVILIFLCICW